MSEEVMDRDTEEEGVKSVFFEGEGVDCEMCGWNEDYGAFYIWPDGKFYLTTRYGCYGGSYTEDRSGVLDELMHCQGFMNIGLQVQEIKKLLKGAQ